MSGIPLRTNKLVFKIYFLCLKHNVLFHHILYHIFQYDVHKYFLPEVSKIEALVLPFKAFIISSFNACFISSKDAKSGNTEDLRNIKLDLINLCSRLCKDGLCKKL